MQLLDLAFASVLAFPPDTRVKGPGRLVQQLLLPGIDLVTLDASGMEPDRLEAATQLSSYPDFLTVADFSRAKRLEFAETVIDPLVWPLFRIASFGESADGPSSFARIT